MDVEYAFLLHVTRHCSDAQQQLEDVALREGNYESK